VSKVWHKNSGSRSVCYYKCLAKTCGSCLDCHHRFTESSSNHILVRFTHNKHLTMYEHTHEESNGSRLKKAWQKQNMHLLDRTQYLKESIARHEKRNPFSCRTPRICCSFRCPAFVSVVALLSVSDLYMSGNEMSAKWWR
jgi:hypothetical protein